MKPPLVAAGWLAWLALALVVKTAGAGPESLVVDGVRVALHEYNGQARLLAKSPGPHKLKIDVRPEVARQRVVVSVELPVTGPNAWPVQDVHVVDAEERPVAVRRSGIEWEKMWIPAPPAGGTYWVQLDDSSATKPRPTAPSENERSVTDSGAGWTATICRWWDGRRAALSIRFDDSHPTHLSRAIPILRQYGFRGTFMVNPGEPNFQEHEAEWEACAQRGDQELANHSMHHRGARGDETMEREIGDASERIWRLSPGKSRLLALNLGGGTTWETTRTLRYYLDKYHLFDASSGSLGMDDTYGNRVAAIREHLERHLERGLWCKTHYHSIGEGLASSEANFRAAMDVVESHQDELWIAGMADIHKYQVERSAARLSLRGDGSAAATLEVAVLTDPQLYDQPLTIELTLPPMWSATHSVVASSQGDAMPVRTAAADGRELLRFDVAPIDAAYRIRRAK